MLAGGVVDGVEEGFAVHVAGAGGLDEYPVWGEDVQSEFGQLLVGVDRTFGLGCFFCERGRVDDDHLKALTCVSHLCHFGEGVACDGFVNWVFAPL